MFTITFHTHASPFPPEDNKFHYTEETPQPFVKEPRSPFKGLPEFTSFCETLPGVNSGAFRRRASRYPSLLSELATSASKPLKNLTTASLDFLSSVPTKIRSFCLEHKEQILRGAKLLAGAAIVTAFAPTLPSLVVSVATLALAALSDGLALFFAIGKITFCTGAILLGLGLLLSFPNRNQTT